MGCVNTNTKEFKQLLDTYGVSKDELMLAVYSFDNNLFIKISDKNDTNLKRWLDYYFKISTPLSDNTKNINNEGINRMYEAIESPDFSKHYIQDFIIENNLSEVFKVVNANNKRGFKVFKVTKYDDIYDFYHPDEYHTGEDQIMAESKDIVDRMIQDAKDHVVKDEENHIYYIDGKPADLSVTQYIHGKPDLGKWGLPSSTLGNSVDSVVRDFFSHDIKSEYPNLTPEDVDNIERDLETISDYLYDTYKNNWKVVSEEFPIYGTYEEIDENGLPVTKTIAGTMDILIYTGDGKFHILDTKTYRSSLNQDKLDAYKEQVNMYADILEAKYPELKGRIDRLGVIAFKQSYPNPNEVEYTVDKNNNLYVDGVPLVEHPEYQAPRLLLQPVFNREQSDIQFQYSQLENTDKELMEETKGKYEVEDTQSVQSQEDNEIQKLFNNSIISTEEIKFLSDFAVKMVSRIINHLQDNPNAGNTYFGEEFNKDYTKLDRKQIINTVGLGRLFNYVKENYFNPENIQNADSLDFDTLDKYQLFYDNWNTAIKTSYALLLRLEQETLNEDLVNYDDKSTLDANSTSLTSKDSTSDVTGDNIIDDIIESKSEEEGSYAVIQTSHQQISAHSSLSQEIRRALDIMEVSDKDGNNILDRYGFGLPTFVDSDEAVNYLLDWLNSATSIEEMEKILEEQVSMFPWTSSILNKIKEEPFRSKFFKNFYKNFTEFSTVIVEDNNGVKTFKTKPINVKSSVVSMLNKVQANFSNNFNSNIQYKDKNGNVFIKQEVVDKLKQWLDNSIANYSEYFKNKSITKNINSNPKLLNDLASVMKNLGVEIDVDILKSVMRYDDNSIMFQQTKIFKIHQNLNNIINNLASNVDTPNYNPISGLNSAKSAYKSLINNFSKYLSESTEASTFEAGKMYYSYTNPSYLGKLFKNMSSKSFSKKKTLEFIENEYGKYRFFKDGNTWNNVWLQSLATNDSYREMFRYKNQLTFDKKSYTDLDEVSYTLSLMSEFFSDPHKKTAWYRIPTLSNKPASEFIRFNRYGDSRYVENIAHNMIKVFGQEIMRIKTVIERANADVSKIKNYDINSKVLNSALKERLNNNSFTIDDLIAISNSGAGFSFMSFLNSEISDKTELGKMIFEYIKDSNNVDVVDLNNKVKESFINYMDVSTNVAINYWESIGLYDTVTTTKEVKGKGTVEESKFANFSHLGNTKEEINENLKNYLWNDYFATINIIQLTVTDLAYYGGLEDFQKRYSQIYAPGLRLNTKAKDSKGVLYSADGNARTLNIADFTVGSEIKDKVKNVLYKKLDTIVNPSKKAEFKKMADLIISSFDDVNVTDAQAYSSPTSYRKKLGMYGEWTDTMEEAYNKIKSGNYDINDLGVVWQPLKPFVYSQINKSTGVDTMSNIKVPIQHKNSEYMLLLADALIRGGKENSKLTAIFDFMEMSAYTGSEIKNGEVIKRGIYNGKGIDTVQFDSAVKSGLYGVIDINDLDTEEAIIERLNSKVYYSKDKEALAENDWDVYNQEFVQTYSFEDYAIQQEVPAHLIDHKQLMGSQFRILSITDMSPDVSIKIKGKDLNRDEIIERYQNLVADNIKDSFEQLKKDFKLEGHRYEQNEALSKILEDTILKDSKMGFDLLRAVKLNSEGEFNIPLSDPMQSIRIQQLLNSIIKSRINKQKVKGGPVVQTSVFGFSEDLKVVFKDGSSPLSFEEWSSNLDNSKELEEGIDSNLQEQYNSYLSSFGESIDYYEAYMPVYDSELERLITKEDGSFMSIEEAIEAGIMNEEMTKAISYRI